MPDPRLIVGIDPGTKLVGFCVLERERLRVHRLGVIEVRGRLQFRLAWIQEKVEAILTEVAAQGPLDVSLEHAIIYRARQTTIALAEARGAILVAIAHAEARLYEYHASAWKKAITGNGAADYQAIAPQVARILRLDRPPPPDAAAAGALAIMHAGVPDALLA